MFKPNYLGEKRRGVPRIELDGVAFCQTYYLERFLIDDLKNRKNIKETQINFLAFLFGHKGLNIFQTSDETKEE